MSELIQTELAATCNALGGMHGGKYVMEPQCYESVRDIIRYLRRDDEYHQVRQHLGRSKILQTDLIHIAKSSTGELFDIVIRLLVSLTNPVMLLYKEELPSEKVGRNIYMNLVGYSQEYKIAFCDVEFWKVIFSKLTALLEVDWAERSEESGLQLERVLVLLRNVVQVPADTELERRPDNDVTVHDKLLWALRESKTLELLLYLTSNRDEQQYYLHLLEIFSLILREQKPELLAKCEIRRSAAEKEQDSRELATLREKEKYSSNKLKYTRTFASTFVIKNVKTFANNDVIYHKSLEKLNDLKLTQDKRRQKTPKNKCPIDSERPERTSAFSVRMFLKEFSIEFLACGFNNLMGYVKDKLVAGKGLPNDESYYFWALKFFLEFACHANVEVKLVSECLRLETFHFAQTQITNCFDHITMDKKKISIWVKRLHLVLKAYHALLKSLQWMDFSKEPRIRESCKILKSNLFYVIEYRELMLDCILRYDSGKYPLSFLRDLIETNHLNLKLLENFCKSSKIVVQRKKKVVKRSKKKKDVPIIDVPHSLTPEEKWDGIKELLFDMLTKNEGITEIAPFDAASSVPIDDQKAEAMKNIQKYLWKRSIGEAIGLLRSARQVWPEGDIFGSSIISVEEEVMALQEICVADLGVVEEEVRMDETNEVSNDGNEDEEEEESDEPNTEVIEQNFEIQDYIKKLVNKKVVEGCSILLGNYKKNSALTNHCVIKLLHRIAWECKSPSMLYQASLFMTLLRILKERDPAYKELQSFSKHLMKKFRENAKANPLIFMELLFWKDVKTAQDIEHGYGTSEEKDKKTGWTEEEEDELRRLWVEFDEKMIDADKIDWIQKNLINNNRSRISIIKKLKELMLIMPGEKVTKKRRGGKEWLEQEVFELTELYNQLKNAVDVATMIKERMSFSKSKKSIKDKLVELGLVRSLFDLRRKKSGKGKPVEEEANDVSEASDSESESEAESERPPPRTPYSLSEAVDALKAAQHLKDGLEWLQSCLEESLEEDEGLDGYPLLAVTEAQIQAMDDTSFQNVLRKLGLTEPNAVQIYWEVKGISKLKIHDRTELIKGALAGNFPDVPIDENNKPQDSEDSDEEIGFERIRKMMSSGKNPDNSPKQKNVRQSRVRNKNKSISEDGSQNGDSNRSRSSSMPESRKSPGSPHGGSNSSQPAAAGNDSEVSDQETGPTKIRKRIANSPVDSVSESGSPRKPDDIIVSKKRMAISDGSGSEHNYSDDDRRPKVLKKSRKPNCLASDSEGEMSPKLDPWKFKRRRCIGSDSEVEENPSDDERKESSLEVRKKSKLLDSDSEVEGHGSMDEADVKLSR